VAAAAEGQRANVSMAARERLNTGGTNSMSISSLLFILLSIALTILSLSLLLKLPMPGPSDHAHERLEGVVARRSRHENFIGFLQKRACARHGNTRLCWRGQKRKKKNNVRSFEKKVREDHDQNKKLLEKTRS
jgi:hypothetical protein